MNYSDKFFNIVRFVAPDNVHNVAFHQLEESLSPIYGFPKDYWRLLLPKSDLQNIAVERVEVKMIRPEWITIVEGLNKLTTVPQSIGRVRKQSSETYCEFTLLVNSLPDGTNWRQFSILRSNGNGVFGTFKSQKTTMPEFMEDLCEHFEKNGFTGALCDIDGNMITVRAYTNGAFYLSEEKCSIGIGKVTDYNTNNPQIDVRKLGTFTLDARYRFDLELSNIAIGNILTLGDKKITVDSTMTAESIKAEFLGASTYYEILQTENVKIGNELGTFEINNDVKPTATALFNKSQSGFDWYKVQLTGDLAVGNLIQINATGRTPITRTVEATDTITSLMQLFNPDFVAGTPNDKYFKVNTGVLPIISIYEGKQTLKNSNALSFKLTNQQAISSTVVDRYQCYITGDIQERNEYILQDKKYIAKTGDTALSVAIGLGQTKRQFTYELPTETEVSIYAKKGERYGIDSITDVTILEQPKVRKSNQVVCEFTLPDPTDKSELWGELQLCLFDTSQENVIAFGNFIDFDSRANDSKMIEIGDTEDVYGFEYYERGLTQRMRIPLHLKNPKHETEENMTNSINGGFYRQETNIMQYREYVTMSMERVNIMAMQGLMRHKELLIDGELYENRGEIGETFADDFEGKGQLTGKLYLQGKKTDSGKFISRISQGYGDISVHGAGLAVRVMVKGSSTSGQIIESAKMPCEEYQFIIDNEQHIKTCIIYVNDIEKKRVVLLPKSRLRIRDLIRLNVDGNIRVVIGKYDDTAELVTGLNELATGLNPTVGDYKTEVNELLIYQSFDNLAYDESFS